jgi:cytochrome P450
MRLSKEQGDVFSLPFGENPIFFLNHPDYIRKVLVTENQKFGKAPGVVLMKRLVGEGLLTSEGSYHSWQRRLLQPFFSHEGVRAYADIITNYAQSMVGRWPNSNEKGTILDIHAEMVRLTRDIVVKSLFGVDVREDEVSVHKGYRSALDSKLVLPFVDLADRLQPSRHLPAAGRGELDKLIQGIMTRYDAEHPRGNLLSALLAARDSEGNPMTKEQIRDEVATLLVAGHATTANALSWAWYLLATNQSVETKLHEELDKTLGREPPSLQDLDRLPYTKSVFEEAIRLYPSVWLIVRGVLEDCSLGEYSVPVGSTILISPYVTHRDPRFFDRPDSFLPDRWTPEGRSSIQRFAYFPFGSGPRSCIGEHFARMEGVLIIASIARSYNMRLVSEHPVKCEPRAFELLGPKYGIRVRVRKRE